MLRTARSAVNRRTNIGKIQANRDTKDDEEHLVDAIALWRGLTTEPTKAIQQARSKPARASRLSQQFPRDAHFLGRTDSPDRYLF